MLCVYPFDCSVYWYLIDTHRFALELLQITSPHLNHFFLLLSRINRTYTHTNRFFCGYFTWNTVWSLLIRSFYLFFASFNFKRKGQKPIQKLNEWKKYIYSAPTWTKSTLTVRFSRLFHVRYFFYSRFLAALALSLSSALSLSLSFALHFKIHFSSFCTSHSKLLLFYFSLHSIHIEHILVYCFYIYISYIFILNREHFLIFSVISFFYLSLFSFDFNIF